MDYNGTHTAGPRNYYFDFSDAKVLVYTGTTFVEYDGSELGAGTWFNGTARLAITDKKDGSFKIDFAYIQTSSYNVTAVSATSKAVSSIVYIGNNADAYAWINYDNVGGHVAGNYEVTYYKALDMLTGEVRTVTFEGDKNERAAEGFYYVDKNNELRQQYNTTTGEYELVSANDQIAFNNGQVKLTKYEVNLGDVVRYGTNVKYMYASTFATDVADIGAHCYKYEIWQPANFQDNRSAVYAGNVYSSDTVVVVIGHTVRNDNPAAPAPTTDVTFLKYFDSPTGYKTAVYEIPEEMYDSLWLTDGTMEMDFETWKAVNTGAINLRFSEGHLGANLPEYNYQNWAGAFADNGATHGMYIAKYDIDNDDVAECLLAFSDATFFASAGGGWAGDPINGNQSGVSIYWVSEATGNPAYVSNTFTFYVMP
jgi:hypothetical protein